MTKQEKQQICDELKRRGFTYDKGDDVKEKNRFVFKRKFVKEDNPNEIIFVNFPSTCAEAYKIRNSIENIVNEIIKEYNENKFTIFEINGCGLITLLDRIENNKIDE